MSLRPCIACARHVRVNETSCPFCSAELFDNQEEPGGDRLLGAARGLTRAALVFAGAATISACTGGPDTTSSSSGETSTSSTSSSSSSSSSSGTSGASSGTSGNNGTSGGPVALYGPAPVDGGNNGPPRPDGGASGAVPLYGPPPFEG